MKATNRIGMFACILSTFAGAGTVGAQTVSVAPIVRLAPTTFDRFPFATPPQSATSVPVGSTFFIEIWATNASAPFNGLSCVYADLTYSKTSLVDSVPPAEDSGLFAIDNVGATLDDAAGTVDTVGGCQADPTIAALGVNEWVLVKRIEMSAVALGGSQTVSLYAAADASPGVTLLGEATPEDSADVDFQSRDFIVRCTSVDDCDDQNRCTNDFCLVGVCANTPIADCCRDAADCDDEDECTRNICNPQAFCENPFEPINTPCGDNSVSDCNGADTCDGNGFCQPNLASAGAICTDDGNECSSDQCDGAGACIHPDVPNQTPCNSDGNECTDDVCNGGECAHPALAADTACGDATVTDCDKADTCDGNGTCQTNYEPASVICRDAANECDLAESCTGQSATCPTDTSLPNGASCSNNSYCDGAETCQEGTCQTGSLPCVDLAHCEEFGQFCLDCVAHAECNDNDDCTSDACSENSCVYEPLDACGLTVPLDIRPGACPNRIKTNAKGVLPIAIVATPGFDIGLIDADSLVLVRVDGVGGLVLPTWRRNGEVKVVLEDVATPFSGETCECHQRNGDGLVDLFLKFSARDVVTAFMLDEEQDRISVELAIEGTLLDGSAFSATDCVQVRVKRRRTR